MAGSISVAATPLADTSSINKYVISWTSDASGNVNTNTMDIRTGYLQQIKFIPGSGGAQPSLNYNATLVDADGVDLLGGGGATLSNTAAKFTNPSPQLLIEAQTVTPTITGAGVSKSGTIILYIGP